MAYVVPTEVLAHMRQHIENGGEKPRTKQIDLGRYIWWADSDDYEWARSTRFGSGVARALVSRILSGGSGRYLRLDWAELVVEFEFTEKQLRAAVAKLVAKDNGRVVDPASYQGFCQEEVESFGGQQVLLLLGPSRMLEEAWEREAALAEARYRKAKVAARGGRVHRAPIPDVVKARVYARDNFTCQKCGATEDLTLDHIEPWSTGGPDTEQNLRVLCRPCNSRKGDRAA